MINAIQDYIQYLHNVKRTSRNTEVSYERDLKKAEVYFKEHEITEVSQITATNLNSYMLYLEREEAVSGYCVAEYCSPPFFFSVPGKGPQTWGRSLGGAEGAQSGEEGALHLDHGGGGSASGPAGRKHAKGTERPGHAWSLLYATGIRVSELIHLKVQDLNWQMGYITCREQEKDRIIPFGNTARKALEQYAGGGQGEAFEGTCK